MPQTAVDLYAFGNATGLTTPRPSDFPGPPGPNDNVGPYPDADGAYRGASATTDAQTSGLTGVYYKLDAGTNLVGMDVHPDPTSTDLNHQLIYPTVVTTYSTFEGAVRGLNWVRQGRIRLEEADSMAIPLSPAGSSGLPSSSGASRSSGTSGDWNKALQAAEALRATLPGVSSSDAEAMHSRLREALAARDDAALILLGVLDPKHTEALLPDLLERALSHRETVAVRRLLGRLPAANARKSVPAAVQVQLRKTPDDDAHRRMAELLAFLGLDAALAALIQSAAKSSDAHVREVAEDFGG